MLTPKQEKFCLVYRETGNASEAYRQSYDASGMNANSVNRKAFDLLEHGKIRARLTEMGKDTAERHKITVDDLIKELEEARLAALTAETPQASAAVGATMGKAKLLGMDKQIIDHMSTDGTMTPKPAINISKEAIKDIARSINDGI